MRLKLKILGILPFLSIAIGLARYAANVPIQDDYDAILNYLNHPWPERFYHLADFHNEHRIISTHLVSEIVYRTLGHIDFRAIIWIGNIGWWIFAVIFAWLFTRRVGIVRLGAVFACWMLVGFYDMENAFWAMTAVQNHWVIAFAFASCLAFTRRSDARWFTLALVLAVITTFTSGGGLLVFPALALMALCDHFFGKDRVLTKQRIVGVMIFTLVAIVACGLMLHNLPHNDDSNLVFPTDPVQRFKATVGFFFCFFGNLIPLVWPALLAGIGIVAWGGAVCRFVPRYRRTSLAIFAFLAFCIATILAATIFRGIDASCALPSRYRPVSAAIIVSFAYLTLVEIPLPEKIKHNFLNIAIALSITLSFIYGVSGILKCSTHKTSLESGIKQWPTSDAGIEYPFDKSRPSAILHKSVETDVYTPLRINP